MAKAWLSKLLHAITDHSRIPASGLLSAGQYAAISGSTTGFYTDTSGYPWAGQALWDDLMIPGQQLGIGAAAPQLQTFLGNITLYQFNHTQNDATHFSVQLPHTYKEGTDIRPHLHIAHNDPTSPTGLSALFTLEYAWTNIDESFPSATTTVTAYEQITGSRYNDQIMTFGDLNGSGKKISSQIIGKITRPNVAQNTWPTTGLFILQFDIHHQIDALGSRQLFIK